MCNLSQLVHIVSLWKRSNLGSVNKCKDWDLEIFACDIMTFCFCSCLFVCDVVNWPEKLYYKCTTAIKFKVTYLNFFRNAALEFEANKVGSSLPGARKTGTTICGVVYKVSEIKPVSLNLLFSSETFHTSKKVKHEWSIIELL